MFYEYMTLGQWLTQDNRLALYHYLLETKKDTYKDDANELLRMNKLNRFIADGEIEYLILGKTLGYRSKRNQDSEFTTTYREIALTPLQFINIRRVINFLAQSEVDVISNFPLSGANIQEYSGYGINTYPYYDLNYYSHGKGKIRGLFKKHRADYSKLLAELREQ